MNNYLRAKLSFQAAQRNYLDALHTHDRMARPTAQVVQDVERTRTVAEGVLRQIEVDLYGKESLVHGGDSASV